jgi:hypothetical protein
MAGKRRQTTQSIAWFWDLQKRQLIQLDPPYQRRSVWSQSYKDYFIDTILLDYPAPAVFLFEDISDDGITEYSVVDGKQRLSTIYDFLSNLFPVGETGSIERYRGLSFTDLPSEAKQRFYSYQFAIEFLPSTDEGTLNNIFDRINRNVARLTPQELRHARFYGSFARKAEELASFMEDGLPRDVPRIATSSKRQMKDVELVAQLLLLTERGVDSYSQPELDAAYSERDEEWEAGTEVEAEFRQIIAILKGWSDDLMSGETRRLRNQADFYSLYGALLEFNRNGKLPQKTTVLKRLEKFLALVADDAARQADPSAKRYYEASRSASNDMAQRRDRVDILTAVMSGQKRRGGA